MEYLKEMGEKFDGIISALREEFLTIRTNRPSPKLIEDIRVSYMEQLIPVKQIGSISVELPRDLVVNVWDQNAVSSLANAIEGANTGMRVASQGKTVRVTLPELTEERKQELIKLVKATAEESRIKMRVVRDEAVKKIKDLKDEDERFRAKEELQKLVDRFNRETEELVESKTKEILE